MAKRAETLRKLQHGWGNAGRVARRSILAFSIVACASNVQAEPIEADASRTGQIGSISAEQEMVLAISSQKSASPAPSASVSSFSAARTDTARILLAQELGGESNRAVGITPGPTASDSSGGVRRGEAQARVAEAADAARQAEENAIVGRSLRAFTRDQEEVDASAPRRRASFSSAVSRAAAAGALTSANPNASFGTSLNSARFIAPSNGGEFDPGFSQAAEALSVIPGLRLESATIFAGYSSNSMRRVQSFGFDSFGFRNGNLGDDYDMGASAVISYNHDGRRSSTRFTYLPSHVQRSRIPAWSTTDHRLAFSTARDLTPRLSLRTNALAGNVGSEQSWFEPAVIRTVETPGSFTELMERVLAGEISDDEFAAILTGSPVVDDPGGSEFDLSRVLTISAGTRASYAHSRRLTLNFGGNVSERRLLSSPLSSNSRTAFYLGRARSTSANFSADYRFSSRTRVSLAHITTFTDSSLSQTTSHSPSVFLSQVLSRHWTYRVGAGIGSIHFGDVNRYAALNTTTWTADGSLAYATGAHNIALSASKRVGDPTGFGGRSTVRASIKWAYQPRFSPWSADAGVSVAHSDLGGISTFGQDLASDLYSVGLTRRLTPSTSFRTDYYYGEFESPFSGIASNISLHRVQMSLIWRAAEPR